MTSMRRWRVFGAALSAVVLLTTAVVSASSSTRKASAADCYISLTNHPIDYGDYVANQICLWWGSGNNYQIQADTFIYGTVNQTYTDPVYNYAVWSYAVGYDSCNGQPWQQTTTPGSAAASYASTVRAYSGGAQHSCQVSHQYREYSQHERRLTSGDGWVGTYAYTYH